MNSKFDFGCILKSDKKKVVMCPWSVVKLNDRLATYYFVLIMLDEKFHPNYFFFFFFFSKWAFRLNTNLFFIYCLP